MIYKTTAYQLEPAASDADAILDAAQVTCASPPSPPPPCMYWVWHQYGIEYAIGWFGQVVLAVTPRSIL